MLAAIDDIHHWHWEGTSIHATNIAVEWQASSICSRFGNSHGGAENGVCANAAFVFGAVELDHYLIKLNLVFCIQTNQSVKDFIIDSFDCLGHTLAKITLFTVTEFVCFVHAGGCARWHSCAAKRTVFQNNVYLNGWVAAAVKDLATQDVDNCGHVIPQFAWIE